MHTLTVELGDRAYPIVIGPELMTAERIAPHIHGRQVLVVTNETVAPLYLSRVLKAVSAFEVATVVLPDGEAHKHLETLDLIFSEALENRFSRNVTFIALGGGVVGDMAGFAAASYQRGVRFLQIPTTLLAQVDSSVGGKTGVNHRLGKNMIGAFHQPTAVFADTDMLKSLPPRELSAGLAEIIKYGLLGDHQFLQWIESNIEALRAQNSEALTEAIRQSCTMKAEIVRRDEREGGVRALLNLGHTFGHAIEAHLGYGDWLHGEAVGAGMVMAAEVSRQLGALDASDVARVASLCASAGLPTKPPAGMTPSDFMTHMAVDKKNVDGQMRFILLRALGDAYVDDAVDPRSLSAALTSCCH